MFNVCATYVYPCLWHTFGYRMRGDTAGATQMALLATGDMQEDELVYHVVNDLEKPEQVQADMQKMFEIIRPGDILSYERTKSSVGHTVIWTSDLDSNGYEDLLHVSGTHYDAATGTEHREETSAVYFNNYKMKGLTGALDFFGNPERWDYMGTWKEYCVIRLTDEKQIQKY